MHFNQYELPQSYVYVQYLIWSVLILLDIPISCDTSSFIWVMHHCLAVFSFLLFSIPFHSILFCSFSFFLILLGDFFLSPIYETYSNLIYSAQLTLTYSNLICSANLTLAYYNLICSAQLTLTLTYSNLICSANLTLTLTD